MRLPLKVRAVFCPSLLLIACAAQAESYNIVDTNQLSCFGSKYASSCPTSDSPFYGQDAQYQGNQPTYKANSNGTVTDMVTQLMWTASSDLNGDGKINSKDKLSYQDALEYAESLRFGGYSDWRLPTIKELYSLILFDGQDPSGISQSGKVELIPFIDTRYFAVNGGDTEAGERLIDGQFVSATKYVSTTMKRDETVFGVNFIDGRIKGYGMNHPRIGEKTFYVLVVRGNPDYGLNQFVDNRDGTISDRATGLLWQQNDSQTAMNFSDALNYCENLSLAGSDQWRLPNIKELQSIVDYSRSPDTSSSAAIDPLFSTTKIKNEANKTDYASYWSSTTHQNQKNGIKAAYIAFGRSLGYMNGSWLDVHGAGSQRSDPKSGSASKYPTGHGPQGDAIRINNMVRCVADNSLFVQQPTQQQRETQTFISTPENDRKNSSGKPQLKQTSNNRSQGNDHFSRMDKNGDGKLSKSEVRGPLASDFSRLDRNGDNYLSRDELPKRR
ncbi:Lcl domain-containing protein [Vibrio sp. SCSIO 43137]|uniref:Lcl domain-containing protein n=1 Tax=Vibrio sp. SCSIO 43137 TaxID=3021011 RepID=UPI002306FE06|nr:DUF1566 domain-containing protein [Vibrio sp. SCSIO 43137]WCE31562.1 DUF1566 domain-containing protein [Vibrio sp. SCSIO 43137]